MHAESFVDRDSAGGAGAFRYEAGVLGESEWHDIVALFSDAVIHQTHTFGSIRRGADKLSHLVLYEGDEIVSAAQLEVVSFPKLKVGIAHCKFGPMWHRRGAPERPEIYREMLQALTAEFSERRGLVLRIKPWSTDIENEQLDDAKRAAGLQIQSDSPQYHTFIIDMSRSIEDLRAGFSSKWRYNLKKAERQPIEVIRASDSDAADMVMELYAEMRRLKSFVDTSEMEYLPEIMRSLPEPMRPMIFVALMDSKPAAAIVMSLIGTTAYYLFGATGQAGRSSGASYVLFWQAMNWLKEQDCRYLDLVGSQPRGTGGGAGYRRFKSGMTAKNGAEYHMSDWEVCRNWRSQFVVHGGVLARDKYHTVRHGLNGIKERISRSLAG